MTKTPEVTIPWTERRGPAIFLILLALIGSFAISLYQNDQIQKTERSNLAKGYLIDVEYVNKTINNYIMTFNDPNNPDKGQPQNFIIPLYPDWGLYYSNRQDISKFPPQLSNDTYYFYNKILLAEFARKEFNNYENLHPLNPDYPLEPQKQNKLKTKQEIFQAYWEIIIDLHNYTIPNLENDLSKVINP